MDKNLPAELPSLARAFEVEREELRTLITTEGLSSNRAVAAARNALERTAERFVAETLDVKLQKSGLWLLEMVKSGAGVLDRATKADIVWREVPKVGGRVIAGGTLFYGSAAVFMMAGFVQGSKLTMIAAAVMAGLRFFDPRDWSMLVAKIPIIGRKKRKLLTVPSGQNYMADAQISVQGGGYVDALADALRTADFILARLAEPTIETTWVDDDRLVGFAQSLLEAHGAHDGGFALKLVESELVSLLRAAHIEIIEYSKKTSDLFDVLPALDMDKGEIKQAAPAFLLDGQLLRRGTVWKA
jgi:hypothetical protein